MQEVLVNRLGGLSLLMKSVVRLTDRPDMILDVYRGRKTTTIYCDPSLKPVRRVDSKKGSQLKILWTNIDILSYLV